MISQVNAAVLVGYGINCDRELQEAFHQAGAQADLIHFKDLLQGKTSLTPYHIIGLPGGFSFADDTGAGNILATKISYNDILKQAFLQHLQEGRLIFGTCNGNQIGTLLNLIPIQKTYFAKPEVAYTFNPSARYEDRGNIHLKVANDKSHWLDGLEGEILRDIPVGHSEGKFQCDPESLSLIHRQQLIALQYVHEGGSPANGIYPINPNGSSDDIAGLASEQVLLMMPHPERAIHSFNQDSWTKRKSLLKRQGLSLPKEGAGMIIFRTGVEYCQNNL